MRRAGLWLVLGMIAARGVPRKIFVKFTSDVLDVPPGSCVQVWDSGPCVSADMCWADDASTISAANIVQWEAMCCTYPSIAMSSESLVWLACNSPLLPVQPAPLLLDVVRWYCATSYASTLRVRSSSSVW